VEHGAGHGTNGVGYQIPLSETSPLDNGHYVNDSSIDMDPNHTNTASGLNFFQNSELENDVYPTSPHGFPTQGISFLQESELGTSQPHEDDYTGERADEVDDLQPSPQLPPQQAFTDDQALPAVNIGGSAFPTVETGEAGNAAAEKMLSQPTSQAWDTTASKTDWAEEASPTAETAPALPAVPEKKPEDEWTTQGSRHARHQSQQRGRGNGERGGRGGRGGFRGEARGGFRGAYRGRGGDRGASNGERRGSYRGGERGRGRGNPPPTAV
jgi:hypothetical protein